MGLCDDCSERLSMKPGLRSRENGPILVDRTEPRHGSRQVAGADHIAYPRQRPGAFGVYAVNPGVRTVDGDELHVQHAIEADVTDKLLLPGDALVTADPAS